MKEVSPIPVAVSWSGGKDAALALSRVLNDDRYHVAALLCAVDMYRDRVLTHDVHRALIEEQAHSLGLPVEFAPLPAQPDERLTMLTVHQVLRHLRAQCGVGGIVYGDIFQEEARSFRAAHLEAAGFEAIFPLWHGSTRQLANEFCESNCSGFVVCADYDKLGERFCGRRLDRQFFRELPGGVDPCGENGEFHTFVTSGPIFDFEIHVSPQPAVRHGRFVYCDLR